MTISHGNITHGSHKGKGTKAIAHNHNGGLLLLLASFSKNPGVIDWNGSALTKKLDNGYDQAVPSCDIWYLQDADVGAHNLTMQNGADNYIYAHFCIISVIGASSDADPFDQTNTNSGSSADSSGTLASCDPTSRTYYVTGLNTAGALKAQTGGAGQTELWDGLNVDNDCSAGYWEDGETAMTSTWAGACAWKTATAELEVEPPPTVTDCDPDSGTINGGTSVTLTGTEFRDGATVTFGGEDATAVVVVGPTEITCDTPAHDAGLVDIIVTNDDAQDGTLENGFEYTGNGGKSHSRRQLMGLI